VDDAKSEAGVRMALQMDWALAIVALTLQLALYAVLSLTVVRMLRVAIAMLGTRARPPTLGFVGWFGPRGLASIVFAVIVVEESNLPHEHRQEGREAEAGQEAKVGCSDALRTTRNEARRRRPDPADGVR
jgi:hypothetical protein